MSPDQELNWWPFAFWHNAHPTKLHQSGASSSHDGPRVMRVQCVCTWDDKEQGRERSVGRWDDTGGDRWWLLWRDDIFFWCLSSRAWAERGQEGTGERLRSYWHLVSTTQDFIYLFLEGKGREGERERNISVWLPPACPLLGTWPTTQVCALTGNGAATLWFAGLCSIHWATPARSFLNHIFVDSSWPRILFH